MPVMLQAAPPSSTRTQDVYEQLRAELLNGRSEPAARLKINELCRSLGVSISAVREALSRLTSDGLVVSEPQRGFRVAPISAAELSDITNIRVHIESLCLERAIPLGDLEWEAMLVAACHRLSRAPERDPTDSERMSDAWSAAHMAFHAALVSACDSPWLLKVREMLYDQSERYRRLSVSFGISRDLNREHREIMEAALARDVKLARTLMTQHLELTTKSLLSQPRLATPQAGPAGRGRLPTAFAKALPAQPIPSTTSDDHVPAASACRTPVVKKRTVNRAKSRIDV